MKNYPYRKHAGGSKAIHLVLLFLCFTVLISCGKQEADPQRKLYLTMHQYSEGQQTVYTYDDDGRLIGETDKRADGTIDLHRTYRDFDGEGMPRRVDFDFPTNPSHKPYLMIEYDAERKPVKVANYATDGTPGPYDTYVYFTNRIEYRSFSSTGATQHSRVYIIDNVGNLLSSESFDVAGTSSWKVVYTGYDRYKAPVHPYKYLAIAISEAPNFFSVNNYTNYETYNYGVPDASYSCNYRFNQHDLAISRLVIDLATNNAMEEHYEYIER